jgi:hypothetical protein
MGHSLCRGAAAAVSAAETLRDLGEMQLAAARTIGLRVPRIAAAMHDPRLLADPELTLMVAEKVEAAAAVATATAPQLAASAAHTARWLNAQAALWSRACGDAASAPSLCGVWNQWQRLAQGVALANAAYGAAMLGAAADLGRVALAPVHKATTGNARRLGPR